MSIEINRLIRILEKVAKENSGADLFVKVLNEEGDLASPNEDKFEYVNDYVDRIVVITG